jgi:hypothetical protein
MIFNLTDPEITILVEPYMPKVKPYPMFGMVGLLHNMYHALHYVINMCTCNHDFCIGLLHIICIIL